MSQAAAAGADGYDAQVKTVDSVRQVRAATPEHIAYLRVMVEQAEHSVTAAEQAIGHLQDSLDERRAELDEYRAALDEALGEPQGQQGGPQNAGEGDA